jgi:hypothetical protein
MSKPTVFMGLLISMILGVGVATLRAGPSPSASSDELSAGFGRPETITGTMVMVVPEQNLVVLAVQTRPDQKTSIVEPGPNAGDERTVKIIHSGATEFDFRMTASSWIRAGGERLTLTDLAGLAGRQVTVRFVPHRAGNFVESIEVNG